MGLADVCRPRSRLDCELLCNIYIFKVILVYWHQEIGHHSLWSGPCFDLEFGKLERHIKHLLGQLFSTMHHVCTGKPGGDMSDRGTYTYILFQTVYPNQGSLILLCGGYCLSQVLDRRDNEGQKNNDCAAKGIGYDW